MNSTNKNLIYVLVILILIVILTVLVKLTIFNSTGTKNSTSSTTTLTSVSQKNKRGDEVVSTYTTQINLDTLSVSGAGASVSDTTITITRAGVYYFTGTLEDGNIVVNAGDNDNVVLVFDNANVTSSTTSAINGINAKNIYINLVEGTTNTFTDSSEYTVFTEDDEPNGTIFSKTDLFINGKGKLIVNANYEDGIVSKDELIITNATIEVTSNDDAIRGKDCVDILDTTITINSKDDGIKSTNETDDGRGYVIIENSDIEITAGDDGIHAEKQLIINSGNINIKESYEGLEGLLIQINGGTINIKASDDGINATDGSGETFGMRGSSNSNIKIEINGGYTYVDSDGDGFDSNGYASMSEGTLVVAGTSSSGNGAIDFENEFLISGGTLIVYGGTGMWQNPSSTSTQYCVCFSARGNSGDEIEVRDSNGNIIESFTTNKSYSAILVSNDKISQDETYTLYVNGTESSSLQVTDIITSEVSGDGFGGGGMMRDNWNQGESPDMQNWNGNNRQRR